MFGNPDPKKLEKMMKKLNMNIQQIEADVVVIKTKAKNIVISKPEVMLTNMMGRDVYQITGEVSESQQVNEEDIRMVMEKTGKDRDAVVRKLEELNNDLARAIIELREAEGDKK
ncbi:MAG: nascent polypeptide-associated complex protein [Candidatus Aenigmarchaeota archaeon]|nr:nascent polypeptide-associated complex protein [Candidatus Aenigmarchaeota archaeon]